MQACYLKTDKLCNNSDKMPIFGVFWSVVHALLKIVSPRKIPTRMNVAKVRLRIFLPQIPAEEYSVAAAFSLVNGAFSAGSAGRAVTNLRGAAALHRCLLFVVGLLLCCSAAARNASSSGAAASATNGRFVAVDVGDRAIVPVHSLARDTLGFVWIGTDAGLYRHDGLNWQRFGRSPSEEGSLCNEHIDVLEYDRKAGRLYVGTDRGFCFYDNAGGFVRDTVIGPRHIKTVFRDDVRGGVWVGTTDGIFFRNPLTDRTETVINGVHAASSCAAGGSLFFGSFGCIWRFDGTRSQRLALGGDGGSSGNLVLALIPVSEDFRGGFGEAGRVSGQGGVREKSSVPGKDGASGRGGVREMSREIPSGSLFVGSERGLFLYSLSDGTLKRIWSGAPVKNFLYLPDGSLAAGTDNGLLLLSPSGKIDVLRHEVGESASIPDNVVWATMLDEDGNFWVGTDHGAALMKLGDSYGFIGIGQDVMSDGLDVSSLVCTASGGIFAAGMNGLMEYSPDGFRRVYKSDRGQADRRLSHNKVRALHFDGEALWAASDGGLDRIGLTDCASGRSGVPSLNGVGSQSGGGGRSGDSGVIRNVGLAGSRSGIVGGKVTHCHIVEPSGKYLSDWMYAVEEDGCGRLWTGTYDGGLFVTAKERLAGGGDVLCDRHLCAENGLSGNIVLKLCHFDRYMAAVTDKGVDVIDEDSFAVTRLSVPDGKRTLSLASDGRRLWVGTEAGVYLLDVADSGGWSLDGKVSGESGSDGAASGDVSGGWTLRPVSGAAVSAQSLVYSAGCLWLCDDGEIWRCETSSQQWRLIRKIENPVFCLAADSLNVYAGSVNGFYSVPKSSEPVDDRSGRVVITSLYLDNVLVVPGREYSGRVILRKDTPLTDKIVLAREQNSFALTFSPMKFPAPAGRFAYRLAGFHDEWQTVQADTRAVFLNVPPGDYSFEVRHLNPAGELDSETGVLKISIMRAWYATVWAFLVYALLLAGFAAFAAYFRKVKRQLRIERAAREKAQSAAASTVSRAREFRETLSAIFGSRGVAGAETPDGQSPESSSAVSSLTGSFGTESATVAAASNHPSAGQTEASSGHPSAGRTTATSGHPSSVRTPAASTGTSTGESSRASTHGSSGVSSADAKFMREISDIVKRHLSDPDFSAAALCGESRWPAKQVYRKIKQLTGLGIVEFIRDIRLSQAAALLEQGRLSVTEIMYQVGFTTPSYFSKCFKSRYGLTPSEYQNCRK